MFRTFNDLMRKTGMFSPGSLAEHEDDWHCIVGLCLKCDLGMVCSITVILVRLKE
jgi:hypothetical protein